MNFRSITTDLAQLEKLKAAEVAERAVWKRHHPEWHYTPLWLNSALVQKLKASLKDLLRKTALPPLPTLPAQVYDMETIPCDSIVAVTVQSRFVQPKIDRRQRTAVTKVEHEMMRRSIDVIADALNAGSSLCSPQILCAFCICCEPW